MTTQPVSAYIARLRELYPDFWDSLSEGEKDMFRNRAQNFIDRGDGISAYMDMVRATPRYTSFLTTGRVEPEPGPEPGVDPDTGAPLPPPEIDPVTGEPVPEPSAPDPGTGEHNPVPEPTPTPTPGPTTPGPTPTPDPTPTPTPTPAPQIDEDARFALQTFLTENELPLTLMGFIQNALIQGWSFDRIVAELRQTPEYQAAYPENAIRQGNGFEWWSEAQIRQYRSEARRLIQEYTGITNVSNNEIADLIGSNTSLSEWERKMAAWQGFERWGETVGNVLAGELGYPIDDERLFAFFLADVPTPELDRAFEMALLRGQPATLGIGVRPEEEAELLRQYGINPDQAFKGYQGIVGEMPRFEYLAGIEEHIAGNPDLFPSAQQLFSGSDMSASTLFRAFQLQDPRAQRELGALIQREVARFQAGGGPIMSQGGALEGLLTDEERNR